MSAKLELLDKIIVDLPQDANRLNFNFFILTIGTISIILLFLFPKIYIQQQIYFKSREIAKLKREYDGLREENRIIKSSVERIDFKVKIENQIF